MRLEAGQHDDEDPNDGTGFADGDGFAEEPWTDEEDGEDEEEDEQEEEEEEKDKRSEGATSQDVRDMLEAVRQVTGIRNKGNKKDDDISFPDFLKAMRTGRAALENNGNEEEEERNEREESQEAQDLVEVMRLRYLEGLRGLVGGARAEAEAEDGLQRLLRIEAGPGQQGKPSGAKKKTKPKDKSATLLDRITQSAPPSKKRKQVSFIDSQTPSASATTSKQKLDLDDNEDEEEDEEDDDYQPGEEDEDDDLEYDSQAEDNDPDSADSPWNGINSGAVSPNSASDNFTPATKKAVDAKLRSDSASDDSSSDSSDDEEDSDSDDGSDSEDSSNDGSSSPSVQGIRPPSSSLPTQKPAPTQAAPQKDASQKEAPQKSAPFEGKSDTKRRNARRRDIKKLKYLQSQGILPSTASRVHLVEWEKRNQVSTPSNSQNKAKEEPKSKQSVTNTNNSDSDSDTDSDSDSDSSSSGSSSSSEGDDLSLPELQQSQAKPSNNQRKKQPTSDSTNDFEQRREALLEALASGGVDVRDYHSSTPDRQSDSPSSNNDLARSVAEGTSTESAPSSHVRKSRLDIGAAHRLLYSSLGVKRPQNNSDRQKVRASLAAKGQRKPVVPPTVTTTSQAGQTQQQEVMAEETTDPNLWKSRINLTAVECVLEDVEYIRPNFPFRQRWDPQMREKKRKRNASTYTDQDASKKNRHNNDYQEYYNDAEGGDALNYDAEDQTNYDDEAYYDDTYYEAGSPASGAEGEVEICDESMAAEAQLLQETTKTMHNGIHTNGDTGEYDNDLPVVPSPDELALLPILTPSLAVPGAIVTFSRLEVSAATKWAPAQAPLRVARIAAVYDEDNGSKFLELQLAKRDVPKKEYDGSGRRLFSGFDMEIEDEGSEGGNDKEGVLEVDFAEVVEGRVIEPAAASDVENVSAGEKIAEAEAEKGLVEVMTVNGHGEQADGVQPGAELVSVDVQVNINTDIDADAVTNAGTAHEVTEKVSDLRGILMA